MEQEIALTPQVILVNDSDEAVGTMEKLEVHQKGLLHRAFSVFILNSAGDMLLQRRAFGKYHSPGLWTNACCSHPMPHESTIDAANRRLKEEMGFDCDLQEITSFKYYVEFSSGLVEHEFDHVLLGYYDGDIFPDPLEVCEWKYVSLPAIKNLLQEQGDQFTFWFKIAFPKILDHLESVSA